MSLACISCLCQARCCVTKAAQEALPAKADAAPCEWVPGERLPAGHVHSRLDDFGAVAPHFQQAKLQGTLAQQIRDCSACYPVAASWRHASLFHHRSSIAGTTCMLNSWPVPSSPHSLERP